MRRKAPTRRPCTPTVTVKDNVDVGGTSSTTITGTATITDAPLTGSSAASASGNEGVVKDNVDVGGTSSTTITGTATIINPEPENNVVKFNDVLPANFTPIENTLINATVVDEGTSVTGSATFIWQVLHGSTWVTEGVRLKLPTERVRRGRSDASHNFVPRSRPKRRN